MGATRHRMKRHDGRISYVNSPVEDEGYERDGFADGGPLRRRRKPGMADVVVVGSRSKPRADKRARGGGVDGDDGEGVMLHHHIHLHHDARDIDPESLAAIHDAAAADDVSVHHHLHENIDDEPPPPDDEEFGALEHEFGG